MGVSSHAFTAQDATRCLIVMVSLLLGWMARSKGTARELSLSSNSMSRDRLLHSKNAALGPHVEVLAVCCFP